MVILINPYSNHGKGLKKWETIKPAVHNKINGAKAIVSEDMSKSYEIIADAIKNGEKVFVSAGGDGGVNYLLNTIISNISNIGDLKQYTLGAIGLGSSNDFHKPFKKEIFLGKIPLKIDYEKALLSDIGAIEYADESGNHLKKYFIINSSIGATADANHFYNHPNKILSFLKSKNVNLAILYAALSTIVKYKNEKGRIDDKEQIISNLGILKIPYFSGDFYYDMPMKPDDGHLWINLSFNMTKINMINTLVQLTKGKFSGSNTASWKTKDLKVNMEKFVPVEIDGETFLAKNLTFKIIPKTINICQ